MSDLIKNAVAAQNNLVRSIGRLSFDEKDVSAGIKDGSLVTSVNDEAASDDEYFYNLFQADITRETVETTLGYVLDCQNNQPGGIDGQHPLNPANVNDILCDKTLGMVYLKPMLNDIELVCTGYTTDAPFVGGGRHRSAAIVELLCLLGLSEVQYRAQKLRVTLLTFTGENAVEHANLYILASNDPRKMRSSEVSAVKVAAATGVHYTDTLGIMSAVKASKVTSSEGLGIIANNDAEESGNNPLTPQAWTVLAGKFCAGLSKVKTELVYVDGTPVMSPKGDTVKTAPKYAKLLEPSAIEDLVNTFNDACQEAIQTIGTNMPSNVARDGVPLISRVALEAVETYDLSEYEPDAQPLKVAKVKAPKKEKVTLSTALNRSQANLVMSGELNSTMKVSDVLMVLKALDFIASQGGTPNQSLTVHAAKSILEGKKPLTASEAQAILNGEADNDTGIAPAQLETIAKSEQQSVEVTLPSVTSL